MEQHQKVKDYRMKRENVVRIHNSKLMKVGFLISVTYFSIAEISPKWHTKLKQ